MKTSRDDLLAIAFRLFLTKGPEHTSMQDLARASGLSKGAFHHYFPRKQDLLDACLERFFHDFLPRMDDLATEGIADCVHTLARRYGKALINLRAHDVPLAAYQAFLWTHLRDDPQPLQAGQEAFMEALATKLETGQPGESGSVRARRLMALIEGTGTLLCLENTPDPALITRRFDEAAQGFLAGLDAARAG